MSKVPGDSGNIGSIGIIDRAEAKPTTVTAIEDEQAHSVPTPQQALRAAEPLVPPGEFRRVDHGW